MTDIWYLTFIGAFTFMCARKADDIGAYLFYTIVFAFCLAMVVDKL